MRAAIRFFKFRILKLHQFAALTPHLASKEPLFKAPPFNRRIVQAIRLISPQYVLQADEESRKFWQTEQNGFCWGEYEALSGYLLKIPTPKKCLEIGPGMGRSVVFFSKKLGLEGSEFHLYESTGKRTKYTFNGPRFTDSFCGSIEILEDMLRYNGITNYKIFDAKDLDSKLSHLPGPYDIIYSFYAVGFHWSLEHFIDEAFALMHEKTLAFFIVTGDFVVFEKLKKFNFKIFDYVSCCPVNRKDKMLVLSKSQLFSSNS